MSNMVSYFGRGIKFNGIDQVIDMLGGGDEILTDNDFTLTFTHNDKNSIEYTYLLSLYGAGIFVYQQAGNLKVRYWEDGELVDWYTPYERNTYNTITISYNEGVSFNMYINGVLVDIQACTGILAKGNTTSFGGRPGSSHAECILSNVQVFNKALTATQIKQQFEEPEKFLYREDEVLKSEFLEQEDIDAVKAYLPMCEVDGYVRNLAGYSEGENEVVNGTFDTTSNWNINQGWAIADGVASCDGTADSYIRQYGAIEPFEMYIVEFDITAYTSGGLRVYLGEYLFIQNITGIGKKSFVGLSGDVSDHLRIHTDDFVGSIDNVTSQKLTSTYPIANFTTSVRDDAKNLSYGLQTSKWKRDVLGVPYASSFDRLECDGSGYVDTGWVPDATKDFQFEVIVTPNQSKLQVFWGIWSSPNSDSRFSIGTEVNGNTRIDIGSVNKYIVDTLIHHILIQYNSVAKTFDIYSDGVIYYSAIDTDFVTPVGNIFLISRAYNLRHSEEPIRLFKIHDKKDGMTPQEVEFRYNELVDKGLLA